MKKTLIVLVGLFVLSAVVICGAGITIGANIEHVWFEENAVYGNASEVEGVIIHRNLKWEDKMFWNVTYVVGDEKESKTEFESYMYDKTERHQLNYPSFLFINPNETFDPRLEYGQGGGFGLQKAFEELVKEAPNNETTHKTIRVKDYTQYYAFGLSVETEDTYFWIEENNADDFASEEVVRKQQELLAHFNDFFRIPVIDNEYSQIGVNKDKNGEIIGYYYEHDKGTSVSGEIDLEIDLPVDVDTFWFEVDSVNKDDTCYFTFQPYTSCGAIVDTSLIPGGYGVYSFKYDDGFVDKDSLTLEYSLEPYGYVNLEIDSQQNNLLVFFERKNELDQVESCLTVLDLKTLEEKQTIVYGKLNEESPTRCYFIEDDFVVAQYDYKEAALLSRRENGTYQYEFVVPGIAMPSGDTYFLSGRNCFDWNGKKLLVAGENRKVPEEYLQEEYTQYNPLTGTVTIVYGRYVTSCGFFLGVFDANGMSYYGEYTCGLDTDWYSEKTCTTTITDSIRIFWPESD